MRQLWFSAAVAVAASACLHFPSYRPLVEQKPGTRVLFRDARVFTATDASVLEHHDVYVEDGLIVAVEPTGGERKADVVIDASGKTVMPGLVDVHVHTTLSSLPPWYLGVPEPRHNAEAFVYAGVTTVNDVGGSLKELAKLRRQIADGEVLGPRIFFAGPIITHAGGYPISMVEQVYGSLAVSVLGDNIATQIESPEQAALEVRRRFAAGATMIKIVIADIPRSAPRLTEPEISAVVREAHQLGLLVAAHIDTREDAVTAARLGVDLLAHGVETNALTADDVSRLAAAHITMAPTLVNFERFCQIAQKKFAPNALTTSSEPAELIEQFSPAHVDAATLPKPFYAYGDELEANRETRSKNAALAFQGGVPIVVGSDAMGSVGTFPGDVHDELKMLVEAGLPAGEVLLGATSRAARLISGRPSFGTLEPGKSADVLVVDGNPLEDISVTRKLVAVMLRGRLVERLAAP